MCYVFIWRMGSPSVARPWEDNQQKPWPSQSPLWKIRHMGVKGKRSGLWAPLPLCWSTNLGELWTTWQTPVKLKFSEYNHSCGMLKVRGAPYVQGTLERGGMRLYLVSHLAGGMCGGILKPQILGQDVHVGRKDCKDFQLSRLRFQLNQYVPRGSINAVCW